ncbi:MAG: hypothetical protein KDB73_18405 [Planctomycetes bacterium]|nr:hypothetical protein [Planctomycetota bacterium]
MSWAGASARQLGGVLWKWKWTYAVPVATLLLPATLYALRLPNTYDVGAVIQINEKMTAASTRIVGPSARDENAFELVNKTRDRLLASDNVRAFVTELDPAADLKDPEVIQKHAERIEWNRLGDNAFSVRTTFTDGQVAQRAVNALIERFLANEKRPYVEEAEKKHDFSTEHRKQAEAAYEASRGELEAFYAKNEGKGTLDLEVSRLERELDASRSQLDELQRERATAGIEIQKIQDELAHGEAGLEDVKSRPATTQEELLADRMKGEQEALTASRADFAQKRATKTENHPSVIRARREMETLEARVRDTAAELEQIRRREDQTWLGRVREDRDQIVRQRRDRLVLAKARVEEIDGQLQELAVKEKELFGKLRAAPLLQEEVKPLIAKRELAYETLKNARKAEIELESQRRFTETAPASLVTPYQLVEPAVAPATPTGPSRKKYLVMALAGGLLLGYGLMLLRRRYDDSTVVDARDVAGMLPGALVVEVPRLEEGPLVPVRHVARDVVFGGWVAGCLCIAAMALAAHYGFMEAPAWLARLLHKGA